MRKNVGSRICVSIFVFAAMSSQLDAAIRYVNAAATGSNNGQTWANAYTTLQAALADNQATEIWVAAGVYKPTASNTPIDLVANIKVYGGFLGTETSLTQRNIDPVTNGTVLSGDLGSGVFASTVIRANTLMTASTTWLDGFTITSGKRTSGQGAGISLTNSASPTIQNCWIMDNVCTLASSLGGGMYVDSNSNPTIDHCTFINNSAGSGGAIHFGTGGRGAITNCVFQDNRQTSSSGSGGAVNYASAQLARTIDRCNFISNVAVGSGGGGAIRNLSFGTGNLDITSSTFIDNQSQSDGGGAIGNGVSAKMSVSNCLFSRNAALRNGGAILNTGSGATATVVNCTVFGNKALIGDGTNNGLGGGFRDTERRG